jgi:nitrite reductase (NADH) small subunit
MDDTYNLGSIERIPIGEGRTFAVGRRSLAVFRTRGGALHATQAECPHLRGPLADGMLAGTRIACPLHGYAFDLETGAAIGHACGALRTYDVSLNDSGELLVRCEERG